MDISKEIKEALIENKKIFYILIILFSIGFIIAYIVADDIAPVLMPILKEALTGGNVTSIDAFSIMFHNLKSAITIFIASIFFGIFAVISTITNGFVVGFMAGHTIKSFNSLIIFLALIIPHGVIEIPALFLSCASGILMFLFIFRILKDKINYFSFTEAYKNQKKTLKHALVLISLAIILFVIAALIEGFITPQLGNIVSQQIGGSKLF